MLIAASLFSFDLFGLTRRETDKKRAESVKSVASAQSSSGKGAFGKKAVSEPFEQGAKAKTLRAVQEPGTDKELSGQGVFSLGLFPII